MTSNNNLLSKFSPLVVTKFAILSVVLFFAISVFGIYKLFNSETPTLYVLFSGYAIFCFLGVAFFLRKKNHLTVNASFCQLQPRSHLYLALLVMIIYTLWVFSIVGCIYTKPILYYIVSSIVFLLISLQVIFIRDTRANVRIFLILSQILLFAFFLRISSYIINPNLIGVDTLYHFDNVQMVVTGGQIYKYFDHYYYFPNFYLVQSLGGILISFSKYSFEMINGLQSCATVLLSYAVGKEIFNNHKTALMSSLLFSIAPTVVLCSVYNTGKIGALALFLLIIWLQLKVMKSKKIEYTGLLLIALMAIFLWHPELSLHVFGIIFASICGYMLTMPDAIKKPTVYLSPLLILYSTIYIGYLIFVHISLGSRILNIIFSDRSSSTVINTLAPTLEGSIDYTYLLQLFFADLGIVIPLFFTIYLGFRWLPHPNRQEIFLLSLIIFLHLSPLLGIVSGKLELGGERSLIAISLVIVILSAGGMMDLFKTNQRNKVLPFVFVMLILSFSSTSSYLVGDGNNVFNDRISLQIWYNTQSAVSSERYVGHAIPDNLDVQWERRSISQLSLDDSGYIMVDRLKIYYRSRTSSFDGKLRNIIDSTNLIYSNGNNALLHH